MPAAGDRRPPLRLRGGGRLERALEPRSDGGGEPLQAHRSTVPRTHDTARGAGGLRAGRMLGDATSPATAIAVLARPLPRRPCLALPRHRPSRRRCRAARPDRPVRRRPGAARSGGRRGRRPARDGDGRGGRPGRRGRARRPDRRHRPGERVRGERRRLGRARAELARAGRRARARPRDRRPRRPRGRRRPPGRDLHVPNADRGARGVRAVARGVVLGAGARAAAPAPRAEGCRRGGDGGARVAVGLGRVGVRRVRRAPAGRGDRRVHARVAAAGARAAALAVPPVLGRARVERVRARAGALARAAQPGARVRDRLGDPGRRGGDPDRRRGRLGRRGGVRSGCGHGGDLACARDHASRNAARAAATARVARCPW